MACDEMLIHTDDAVRGLGLTLAPDGKLAGRVLARLYPWHDPRVGWKWVCAPLADWNGKQPPVT